MAGYFTKHDGYVYLGSKKAGEVLANGLFVSITSTGVKKITAAGAGEYRIEEKTTLWGLPAVRLICTKEETSEIYVTENELEDYVDNGDFNSAEYTIPVGHYVKMRRPVINDELNITIDSTLWGTLAEGDTVTAASGGSIAKKT